MTNISGDVVVRGDTCYDTMDGLIRSLIQKYHPGLTYVTGVPVDEDDSAYYGEWSEDTNSLTFTDECDTLDTEELTYVVLHEISHALTGDGKHQERFYGVLTALVDAESVSWETAIRVEEMIPLLWERYLVSA